MSDLEALIISESKIEELESQIKELQSKKSETKEQKTESKIEELESQIKELESQIKELQSKKSETKEQKLESKIEEPESKIEKLESKKSETKEQKLESKIEKLESKIAKKGAMEQSNTSLEIETNKPENPNHLSSEDLYSIKRNILSYREGEKLESVLNKNKPELKGQKPESKIANKGGIEQSNTSLEIEKQKHTEFLKKGSGTKTPTRQTTNKQDTHNLMQTKCIEQQLTLITNKINNIENAQKDMMYNGVRISDEIIKLKNKVLKSTDKTELKEDLEVLGYALEVYNIKKRGIVKIDECTKDNVKLLTDNKNNVLESFKGVNVLNNNPPHQIIPNANQNNTKALQAK